MKSSRTSHPFFWLMLGSSVVLALSLGIRHGFGLFLTPMSTEFGWGRETFALAIALQNLVWGLVQPFTGALADRIGAWRVITLGTGLYALGLLLMGFADTPLTLSLSSGVLMGLALSGTSFTVVLGAIGRAVPPQQRSLAMGLASAAGSLGQFVMLPGTLALIKTWGWSQALVILAALALLMLPFASLMRRPSAPSPVASLPASQTGWEALHEAAAEPRFWLLCFGFFVCGFQVVFIGIYLPAYLLDQQIPAQTGTTVLALVGLFNIFGTYTAGWLGNRYAKAQLLTGLYLMRAGVIGLFLLCPVTSWSAYLFGMAMGFLWLSTVPLTNGIVASIFGVRHLSMLSGIVFLFHQIGSFLGGWLGGYVYDRTGQYDLVWHIALALCFIAALVNWPIKEHAVPRLTAVEAI